MYRLSFKDGALFTSVVAYGVAAKHISKNNSGEAPIGKFWADTMFKIKNVANS